MTEAAPGFFQFLSAMEVRFLQEREVGLDLYLSGMWGIVPSALAVAAGTTFLLAIFQAIPRRRHSIPVLLGLGLVALILGLLGSYVQYTAFLRPGGPPPRVIMEGIGPRPSRPGQEAAVLALPLLVGGATLAAALGGVLFLAVFGGPPKTRRKA